MKEYKVKAIKPKSDLISVDVPASKSILNRALLLAAIAKRTVYLHCGSLSEDTKTFLDCLTVLGIKTEQKNDGILIYGCGGSFPNKNAAINVNSAGTAARFLTVALAFAGGDYMIDSSEQMKRRPMEILELLENDGVNITYLGEKGRFPFRLQSDGIRADVLTIDTDHSTQYASGIMLAASMRNKPLELRLTGKRINGSYLQITKSMLQAFHVPYQDLNDRIIIFPAENPPTQYAVEPDVSGACYFYALSLLLGARVRVNGVHMNGMQGDLKFLKVLANKGVILTDTDKGVIADGSTVEHYSGFDEDLRDFSDQTMTLAALAPFATSRSILRGIGHIRLQECDRIAVTVQNLKSLGITADTDGENIFISPSAIKGGAVDPHNDHRMAMAFSLIGLKTGNVVISDPDCCKKTFENFFDILTEITKH